MEIVGKAFNYTKDGLFGNLTKWILIIILMIIQGITLCIVPLLNGYMIRIFAGNDELPEINEWGKLFVDGWKFNITAIVYMIPVIVIGVVFGLLSVLPLFMEAATGGGHAAMGIAGAIFGLLITFVVLLIISLFMFMGLVRIGKTGKLGEAFNFHEINRQISEGTGWLGYIGYIILLWILGLILGFIILAVNFIPILGIIITILLVPAWEVFSAKYMTNIYDVGGSA